MVSSESTAEPRRSSRIKPKAPADNKSAKRRSAKGTRKRKGGGEVEDTEIRQVKKAKAEGEENGAEQDQLADDDAEEPVKVLEIGDVLPSLALKNEKDEDINVADLVKEKGLVLFLVPKADTPGCTKQACGFRDSYSEFTKLNYNVYCVSADTGNAQAKWQAKQSLPYSLLSDRQRVLIKILGAADGNKTKRSHFVFEKEGKLVDKKIPVKPVDSPQQALEFIRSLQG